MSAPVLKYSAKSSLFGLMNAFGIRDNARQAGFTWDDRGFWKTASAYRALRFFDIANEQARTILKPYVDGIRESQATNAIIPVPAPVGLEYLPFQKAGIAYASRRMSTLIGDEPGLGKTIQAVGLANYLGLSKMLVLCPAGLRLNWAAEVEKWHLRKTGIQVILNGKQRPQPGKTIITSYDLCAGIAKDLVKLQFDMAVADEGHYLKNPETQRTKLTLGFKGFPGLVNLAPRKLVLTGTPIPNRVNEVYPVVRRIAPETIDNMSYRAFLNYYAVTIRGGFGEQIVGIRNEEELYMRLRAGVMVRRLKKDVLKDLPPKQYKMVVFPKSGYAKVLKREAPFSAAEIVRHGVPVGSALPEVRHEMGIAKAPQSAAYITDLLDDGIEKVIVFAYHKEVIAILSRALAKYGVVVVTGDSSATARQSAVNEFQNNKHTRVFIGNLVAAGVGITLTKAADVVFVEGSWVPGENEQTEDRAHRIGQGASSVMIHYLVVEESLDATILGSAARKRKNIRTILDGGEAA